MLRLFVPSGQVAAGTVRIAGPELRHLRTCRLAAGDRLRVFDDHGAEHEVVLEEIGARAARARIVTTLEVDRESPLELVLAPALLKGSKMDLVVEKATELGVHRIVPIVSRHAIGERAPLERWTRLALAASKQSGRSRPPEIEAPRPLADLVRRPWPGLRLLAWENEATQRWPLLPPAAQAAVIAVGPEGGFAPDEVRLACDHGFVTVRLAGRVLRAETAAIVAVTICQHRWGDG